MNEPYSPLPPPLPPPTSRPKRPYFSSGPCAKPPNWTISALSEALLGRSHRSAPGKARLKCAIDLTREILEVPANYPIALVPASDTGAMEMALWSLLGAPSTNIDVLVWESFGECWMEDILHQLKLNDCSRVLKAPYGEIPDLNAVDPDHDVVFVWNGTTSGVRVPNAEWISPQRKGLTFCDATSAVFAQKLDWEKLDVITFSWQKVLGGEAAHGILILSPRAVARAQVYTPVWPLPKIFRFMHYAAPGQDNKLMENLFQGETINTPSMLCVEDYLEALRWAKGIGGLQVLQERADTNAAIIADWVDRTPWIDFLAADPSIRSNTSVCLKFTEPHLVASSLTEQRRFVQKFTSLLEKENIALDIAAYREAPPGLRIWCGATIIPEDIQTLLPWLEWAYQKVR